MSRGDNYLNGEPNRDFNPVGASKEAIRKEFAKRLSAFLADRGWNQSELARRADDLGASRVSRDDISGYVRGQRLPGPGKERQIAAALGVALEELIPSAPSVDRDRPDFEVRSAGNGAVWIKMEKRIPYATAVKVMELLQDADES